MSEVARRPAAGSPVRRRHVPLRSTCARPHACPAPVRREVLSRVPLFAGLSAEDLLTVDARMTSLAWAEGDPLYRAGEPAEHLYVLAVGRAKVLRTAATGQDVVVDLLAPGDLAGPLGAGDPHDGAGVLGTSGAGVHTETVVALSTVCALRIGLTEFRAVLEEHPAVALRVLDTTLRLLAEARADVVRQSTADVAQRVAATLLRLDARFGQERAAGGTLLQLPLSRADLAGMTGSTPESVSRVMSRLRREGVLETGRRWTAIRDRERLAAVAAGAPRSAVD
nr:Crp/Fnr family transcriptional regulator [uncultured Actinotalea sp.]